MIARATAAAVIAVTIPVAGGAQQTLKIFDAHSTISRPELGSRRARQQNQRFISNSTLNQLILGNVTGNGRTRHAYSHRQLLAKAAIAASRD
jgi:hypothetical protein